jgi:hypothetical protein
MRKPEACAFSRVEDLGGDYFFGVVCCVGVPERTE